MNKNVIWVEKYRPMTMGSVIGQKDIVDTINSLLKNNNIQHMVFYGPPGTGKTTVAHNICRYFYNRSNDKELNERILSNRLLELDASNDRGINIARLKIKNFIDFKLEKFDDIPDFKIIILDEADALTQDSQYALRRMMDESIEKVRFILLCNYIKKIIEPLLSRCSPFRFKNISLDSVKKIVNKIGRNEGFNINDEFVNTITNISKGDLRIVINLLEQVKFTDPEMKISTLYKVSNVVDINYLNFIWEELNKKINISDFKKLSSDFYNTSYSSIYLLSFLTEKLIENNKTSNKILNEIANADSCISSNSDEYIYLLNIFIKINKVLICSD